MFEGVTAMLHGRPTFRVRAEEGIAPQPAGQGVFFRGEACIVRQPR